MRAYQYYSAIFKSEVQITYNKNGFLIGLSVVNGQEVEKVDLETGVLKNYVQEAVFLSKAQENKLKLVQVDRKITFLQFWDAYKQKDCGRSKAEQVWDKLSKADQLGAYDFIPAFDGILKVNQTAKPYATTYLNQKRWIR